MRALFARQPERGSDRRRDRPGGRRSPMPRFCRWLVVLLFVLHGCSSNDAGPGRAGIGTWEDGSSDNDGTSTPTESGATAPTESGAMPTMEGSSIADADAGGDGGSIAAKYPGDIGIENDPEVIFADDFEAYSQTSDLSQKWDNFFQVSQTLIVTDPATLWGGLEVTGVHAPPANDGAFERRAEDPEDRPRRSLSALLLQVR